MRVLCDSDSRRHPWKAHLHLIQVRLYCSALGYLQDTIYENVSSLFYQSLY